MSHSLMIYTKQLEDEILGTHRKEKDAQAKFEEDKLEIIKDISRVKAEMNTMFKEKSSIKSKIMEINQKFKDREFVVKDELEIELNIMSRAHLGMKTFEEQIKRITKEIEDEEKKEEKPKSPLKKRKTEMNMLKFMDPKSPKENKPKPK